MNQVSLAMFSGMGFPMVLWPTKSTQPFCRKTRWLPLKSNLKCQYTRYGCRNKDGMTASFNVHDQGKEGGTMEINNIHREKEHGDLQTGSSCNLGYKRDRKAISTAIPRLLRTPRQMEHRPTTNYAHMVSNSTNRKSTQQRYV